METWLIILLCTVFAWIVIGADFYFKGAWLPRMREGYPEWSLLKLFVVYWLPLVPLVPLLVLLLVFL